MSIPRVRHHHLRVGDVEVFLRESEPGQQDAPVLLLLHGFPSASHQFRRLIDALGNRYRLIAPDYPGFGHTQTPDGFSFTFDRLAEVMDGLVAQLGLSRFALYMFDFGAPVGFRLAERYPDRVTGLIVQNGNLYREGLSDAARAFINLSADDTGAEETVRALLTLEGTRTQYDTGVRDVELIAPEGWTLDQHFLDIPGRKEAQVSLAFDYKNNLDLYPRWQEWLRTHQPPTLIVWGRGDPFFVEQGARAYLNDLPRAELHVVDTGHFALEEQLDTILPLIVAFLEARREQEGTRPPSSIH